jgi:hypothetical protein
MRFFIFTVSRNKTMGCCCSCFTEDDGPSAKDIEMKAKSLAISPNMTSPHITMSESGIVSGEGLALAGVQIEQDAAYWEWHIQLPSKNHCDTMLFGVTGKKNREFYRQLDDKIPGEEGEFHVKQLSRGNH